MIKDGVNGVQCSNKSDTTCNAKSQFFHSKDFPSKSKKKKLWIY